MCRAFRTPKNFNSFFEKKLNWKLFLQDDTQKLTKKLTTCPKSSKMTVKTEKFNAKNYFPTWKSHISLTKSETRVKIWWKLWWELINTTKFNGLFVFESTAQPRSRAFSDCTSMLSIQHCTSELKKLISLSEIRNPCENLSRKLFKTKSFNGFFVFKSIAHPRLKAFSECTSVLSMQHCTFEVKKLDGSFRDILWCTNNQGFVAAGFLGSLRDNATDNIFLRDSAATVRQPFFNSATRIAPRALHGCAPRARQTPTWNKKKIGLDLSINSWWY